MMTVILEPVLILRIIQTQCRNHNGVSLVQSTQISDKMNLVGGQVYLQICTSLRDRKVECQLGTHLSSPTAQD